MRTALTHARRGFAAAAAVFTGVSVVHLVAELVAPDKLVSNLSQPLLMPALAAVLARGTADRGPLVRGVLLALGFSWLGDTLPRFLSGDAAFLSMVGAFLLAQFAYIRAFAPDRQRAAMARNRWLLLPYLAAFAALVLWCAQGAGGMVVPIVIYGAALTLMAVLATGVSRTAGVGGAVFMLSDALIALRAFAGVDLPAHGFWVMFTYLLGQGLIVAAVIERSCDASLEQV